MILMNCSRDDEPFAAHRRAMVENQIIRRGIRDQRVTDAMLKVERHLFVPGHLHSQAYTDRALPIAENQTISQPYIVALMTEVLELKKDHRVLEIGTGSGYQAAILGEITAEVFSVEIIKPLADSARVLLNQLGYKNITVKHGDGYAGWKEYAPYDAIIVTAAPEEIPQALIEQLKIDGRMVVPVGREEQDLILITKTGQGIVQKNIIPVRFVPMVKNPAP
ncbi:MAG: protein-L-isoaspartate(D-aspartate) O-methyltransferase [Candidatus Omnitrophota bacterium]